LLIKKTTIEEKRAENEKFFAFFSKIIWLLEKKSSTFAPAFEKSV
jgi:hypothetical protein